MDDLIRIRLRGPASRESLFLLVDPGIPASGLMPVFLKKLGIKLANDEPPFLLHHSEGGGLLDPGRSLRDAGVKADHEVVLLPSPIGRSPRAREQAVDAFKNAARDVGTGKRTVSELEALLPAAEDGALTADQKLAVAGIVQRRKLASAVPWAARLLADPDDGVREKALRVLQMLRAEDRTEEIRPLLSDPSGAVRGEAARVLSRFRRDEADPAVWAMIDDPDPAARAGAADALEQVRYKDRGARLLPLLRDPDPLPRAAAIRTLSTLDSPSLRRSLGEHFRDPEAEVVQAACEAAATLRLRDSIPDLVASLRHADDMVRLQALDSLVKLDARESSEAIRALLADKDDYVRRRTLDGLIELGTVEARDAARFAADPDLRALAVVAYQKAGASGEIPAFLSDADPVVQTEACAAVAGPGELRRLKDFLAHPDPRVRFAAVEGLRRRDVRDAAPSLQPLLQDPAASVRAASVAALARFDAAESADSIAALLADPDTLVRLQAADSLRRLGAAETAPALRRLLTRPGREVRLWAVRLLEDFDDREGAAAIAALIDDRASLVRTGAIRALARMGIESAAAALKGVAGFTAAAALASFGDSSALRGALDPACDPDPDDLALLNGAREPVLWKRLRDTRVNADLSGAPAELVSGAAAQAGMAAELPPEFRARKEQQPGGPPRIRVRGRITLLTALRWATGPEGFDFILESGRIRVLTPREAAQSWASWL